MENDKIQLFEDKKIRTAWDDEQEEWYFSIVDVVGILTDNDYQGGRKYWKVLKGRLKDEGNQLVSNCYQLKMTAPDGKKRMTDVATMKQLLQAIQVRKELTDEWQELHGRRWKRKLASRLLLPRTL